MMLYRVRGDYITSNTPDSYNNLRGNTKTHNPFRQIYP
jgi:hypothetical protein